MRIKSEKQGLYKVVILEMCTSLKWKVLNGAKSGTKWYQVLEI